MEDRILSQHMLIKFKEHMTEEEKSLVTIEKYLRDINRFRDFACGRKVEKNLVAEYKKLLNRQGYTTRSVNSMLASLNCFLKFAGWNDCTVKNIRLQKQAYCPEEKELTKAEYMRLLEAADKKEQLQLVMQTICSTGIRISELKYFTVEAVAAGQIVVYCKNKVRTIFVPQKLKKLLLAYAKKQRITDGCIFVTKGGKPLDRSNIWAQMKKLCTKAKVNPAKVFPHNLRKLFAKIFYSIEKDIAKLADILGHSSIETTRIYIMTSGAEHRRKIEKMGLLA